MNILHDPFMERINVEVLEIKRNGIVLQGNVQKDFYNVYGIAHGGYLYTLGHVAAQLTGELCMGGGWEVADASCQYLHPLRIFPAKAETMWVGGGEDAPCLRIEVRDGSGKLCFEQNVVLREDTAPSVDVVHTPTIFTDRPLPNDCYEQPQFPCITSTFSKYLNIYSTGFRDTGLVYTVDLTADNCDGRGYAHPGAIFTAADAAAGGSLYYVQKKRPITVSASIHYFDKTTCGPVHTIPRLVRGGRSLYYYDLDIVDGRDRLVAIGQFIIQNISDR